MATITPIQRDMSPTLESGDRLTAGQFHRAYRKLPNVKKAELVKGVVFMASPVSAELHGNYDGMLAWILGSYKLHTSGLQASSNSSIYFNSKNAVQPDQILYVKPSHGGSIRFKKNFIVSAPDLVAEVSASSVSLDLGWKKQLYRKVGVREYLVVRVNEGAVDWFVNVNGRFELLPVDADGIIRSTIFPGLWLHPQAFLNDDSKVMLETLNRGLASHGYAEFVKTLKPITGS